MYDTLSKFIFEDRAVRGELVHLEESYQTVLNSYHYPEPIAQLLGELMAAASLLTATIKFKGEVSLQIQSEGIIKYAVINATHEQKLRGVARWDESIKAFPSSFQELFNKGSLAITLAPKNKERYQGIVALDKPSLAECLEDYFLQSEQLLTKVYLATENKASNKAASNDDSTLQAKAAGMLLQIIPETSETYQSGDNEDFTHLSVLADTITPEELLGLEKEVLIHRLFHEEDLRLFAPQAVAFECDCSSTRSAQALRNVPKAELLDIVKESGSVKMNCQFCHTEYAFDAIDIEHIHSDTTNMSQNKH